ncbi:MAG: uroporphyrinogen-III synthase [Aquificaceae bacterium]|jgi:uroporphyrinogen-III synthase|uniref:uroporphyrinogen-III synthase n=1 Tax=Hydrogenobacter sp. Uz 6-8 TaxID=3384828 RepID=UPI000F1433BD|nr:MAG: uroporphyrinogen-III synthase [Aquificota bacterium]
MSLRGKRIAVCATRRVEEIVEKISQMGGKPYVEEIVRIEYLPEQEVYEALKRAMEEEPSYFVFTTGEGAERLFEIAERHGLLHRLNSLLLKAHIVVRGYKARGALARRGYSATPVESTSDIVKLLRKMDIKGKSILIQMFGEDLPELERFVYGRDGNLIKVWVYRYVPDSEKIDTFIDRLLKGFYHAVLFTSAFQVRHLYRRAKEKGVHSELSNRMNQKLLSVAMGTTTAQALFENGVLRVLIPEKERLSFAVRELERAFKDG